MIFKKRRDFLTEGVVHLQRDRGRFGQIELNRCHRVERIRVVLLERIPFRDPLGRECKLSSIAGPDNWRLVVAVPGDRGVVCGALAPTAGRFLYTAVASVVVGLAAGWIGRHIVDRIGDPLVHLVRNAIQAMNQKGRVWVTTQYDTKRRRAVVSIASLMVNLRLRLGLAEKER